MGEATAAGQAPMSGNCDRWQLQAESETKAALAHSTHLVAQGIATKLSKALGDAPNEMDAPRWGQLVEHATRDAFIEITDGPLVKLGQNQSFIDAVAECTAHAVAPAGSNWALTMEKLEEQRERKHLAAMGVPPAEINRLANEWRTLPKT